MWETARSARKGVQMSYDPHRHGSLRMKGYDYAQPGAYFVTLRVRGGTGPSGQVVEGTVVLPNHLHGILILGDDAGCRGRSLTSDGGRAGLGYGPLHKAMVGGRLLAFAF